jgi:hypothetical protein
MDTDDGYYLFVEDNGDRYYLFLATRTMIARYSNFFMEKTYTIVVYIFFVSK